MWVSAFSWFARLAIPAFGGLLDDRQFRILELAGARVVEDCEVALVDVFAESRAASLHLLVKDGAPQWTHENDILHIRRVESGREQIDGHSNARIDWADYSEVPLKLVAVPSARECGRRSRYPPKVGAAPVP